MVLPKPRLAPGALADTVGFRIRVAQLAAYRSFEGRLARYGIAPRYLGLLGIIANHPGQPQSRLAEAVSLKRSSLVPIMDRLELDGLIERRSSAADRRCNAVWLTEKGSATVGALTAEARREDERLSRQMTEADRRALLALLARVNDNLAAAEADACVPEGVSSPE